MSTAAIRVLIVEDNFYTRLGTVAFLRGQPGIEVVGEAPSGALGLSLFPGLAPDVTVVDLRMPGMDGVQLTRALRQRDNHAVILVLTHYDGEEDVFAALREGARGYLTKEAPGDELVSAIRAVHAGRQYLPPAIVERMTTRMLNPPLTEREMQVLAHVANGATNAQIATRLKISIRTVGLYVSAILSKLRAQSRTEAVALARQRGLLSHAREKLL